MISPRTGRATRARRSALACALSLGLIAAPAFTAVPAFATSPAPSSAVDPEVDDGTVELHLTAGVHGVIQPGSALTANVTIDNDTTETLAAGRVTVELNSTALADADALTAWLESGTAAGTFTALGTEQSDALPASQVSVTTLSAPAATLGDLPEGVYPLRASLTGIPTTGSATTSSVLIVSADRSRTITVLVPITATPANGALLTSDELAALTGPDGSLAAQLDGVAGTSAVLAVDPLIPAAIRVLGSAAPVSAIDWLARLEALPNERFALQAADADATVQARAELPHLLEPLSFETYLDTANFAATTPTPSATASASPSPSPSATPDPPVVPSPEELTAIRGSESGILWPLGDVQTADLSVFDDYLGGHATTIVPSTALATTPAARISIDGHRVLAVDAAASEILSGAAATADDALRETELAAGLAQLSFTAPQTSLLIGLDRDETRTVDALRETILSLSTFGTTTSLADLQASPAASSTLAGQPSDARAHELAAMLDDEESLTAFASILDNPLVLLAPERLQLLRTIAVGTANDFPTAVQKQRDGTQATLDSVSVQQPSPIQLFTAAAPLPVWVRNDLPWPVNVQLTSQPSDARLDVQKSADVVAQPSSNTRVKVPVSARVGSGTLSVTFSLTSPTGVHIGTDQTANVTVRAEWESIGLGILGGLIGLLLVFGIIRTIVRRRRDSAESSNHESDAATEA